MEPDVESLEEDTAPWAKIHEAAHTLLVNEHMLELHSIAHKSFMHVL